MWKKRNEAKKSKWNENEPKSCLTKKKSEAKTNGNKQNEAKKSKRNEKQANLLEGGIFRFFF
jgi:hypothetical protein